ISLTHPTRSAIALTSQRLRYRTFINPTYIYLIALLKAKMIAVLKFNQQDDGDRTTRLTVTKLCRYL
ncbi:MAG: hypothetical protein ACKPFK_31150, partial [Dolichospermum sp.]